MNKKLVFLAAGVFTLLVVGFSLTSAQTNRAYHPLRAQLYDNLPILAAPDTMGGYSGFLNAIRARLVPAERVPVPIEQYYSVPPVQNSTKISTSVDSNGVRTTVVRDNLHVKGGLLSVGPGSVRLSDNRNSLESNGGFLSFIVGSGSWPPNSTIQGLWERMRILANGNVGIGTNLPNYRLTIKGDTDPAFQIISGNTGSNLSDGGLIGLEDHSAGVPSDLVVQNLEDGGGLQLWVKKNSQNYLGLSVMDKGQTLIPNDLCLPDGSTAVSDYKCFKAVCPGVNGQWTLSENAICSGTAGPLRLTASLLGAVSQRTRVAVDDIALITLSAPASTDINIQSIKLTFQGAALTDGKTVTARLIDPNTNTDWQFLGPGSCVADVVSRSCEVAFSYADAMITRGTSKSLKVRVNSSQFYNTPNTFDGLSVYIQDADDVLYNNGQTLNPNLVPFTIVNIAYE